MIFATSCQDKEKEIHGNLVFAEKLSEMNLFEEPLKDQQPLDDVVSYELNTPLFTDYAYKKRFIKLPKNENLHVEDGQITYPDGTVLIKNFYYLDDERIADGSKRILETRLLIKESKGWEVGVYEWNDEQTDATFLQLGNEKEVAWMNNQGEAKTVDYVIPDANDCKGCHMQNGEIIPIGPKLQNLNYQGNDGLWQLDRWIQSKFLTGIASHEQIDQLPVWDNLDQFSVTERARAYLDVNCAHCHTQGGPADNTGLFYEFAQDDPFKLGVNKGPISAGAGSSHLKYDIVAGHADSSIVYFRMNSTETGVAMPELGRTLNHSEGLELIKEWINTMD